MLKQFLFNSLPFYFGLHDFNKDANGEGTLERYLSAFEDELQLYKDDVSGFIQNADPKEAHEELLQYISAIQGYPPETFHIQSSFRNNLRLHTHITQGRGRIETARDYFKALGADLEVTELPNQGKSSYDNPLTLYDKPTFRDQGCNLCRYYDINILDPEHNIPVLNITPVPTWAIENLTRIFEYLLPINCFITNLYYNDDLVLDPVILIRKYSTSNNHLRINGPNIIRKV